MASDDSDSKTPEVYDFCHNSNSLPSEDPSDGSIISYLQFQRPETPPEYRGEDWKENPNIEVVSFIADDQNPIKSEVPEVSFELPSSSPSLKECSQKGDEMAAQQFSQDANIDFPLSSPDNASESLQLSQDDTTELVKVESTNEIITGDNRTGLQDLNMENSTTLPDSAEANAPDAGMSLGEDVDLFKGDKTTEAESEGNRIHSEHMNEENAAEIERESEKNIVDMKTLHIITNDDKTDGKPPVDENTQVIQQLAENANIAETQNLGVDNFCEKECVSEDDTTDVLEPAPDKETINELEYCNKLTFPEPTHPKEESITTEIQHQGNKSTCEMQISEEERANELERLDEDEILESQLPEVATNINLTPEYRISNYLEQPMEENTTEIQHSIDTKSTELQSLSEVNTQSQGDTISDSQHNEGSMGDTALDSQHNEGPMGDTALDSQHNEGSVGDTALDSQHNEGSVGDTALDSQHNEGSVGDTALDSQHNEGSVGDTALDSQHNEGSVGDAALDLQHNEGSVGDTALDSQHNEGSVGDTALDSQHNEGSVGDTALDSQHNEGSVGEAALDSQHNEEVKLESEYSDNRMDTQQKEEEANVVISTKFDNVEVSDGAEQTSTETEATQHDITRLHDKSELDVSEMEHQLTDEQLIEREMVGKGSEANNDLEPGNLPTSSPKHELQDKQQADELSVQEKQPNAVSLEQESKLDPLVIPAPTTAPSAVMQEHMSNEEYRIWKEVLENPEDFDAWVKLLALAEKHENPIVIRETFDRFLKLYPYCYGYWRKFADLVLRLQGWPHSQQILEIGVYSIPLSIDLWLHYAALSFNQGIDYTAMTALYDRSLEIAGYEYRSDLLWEAAMHFQESQNQMVKVFTLLRQLIATPTQHYKKHFHKYESLLNTRSICELLSPEEFKTIGEQTKFTRLANDSDKSLDEKVRDCLLDQGRQVHAATEEEIGLRQPFEERIKRPYFHVQPLEETQLQTWQSYLDFEIARKYKDRIVFLFERCMIVCALYEEMWIKYAKFLGSEYSEETRAVFQRGACYIPKSAAIHLEWSLFEESLGQLDRARELLHTIDQKIPDLIETRSRYISFELRHGNKDKVDELYKKSVSQSQKQFQKSASHPENSRLPHDVYNYWVTKYVFFLHRHRNEHAVAKKMLFDAIEKDKNNSELYFSLVDLEMNHQPLDKEKVMSVLNKAIHAPLVQEVKAIFSLRKLQWAEAMGIPLDYKVMNELRSLRNKSIAEQSNASAHAQRKRPNEDESDSSTKHPRMDSSSYPSDPNQHNVNYQQNIEPTQQQYPPYYQGYQYQGGEMADSSQQWSQQQQQYNYQQQDWGYQHQYYNQ